MPFIIVVNNLDAKFSAVRFKSSCQSTTNTVAVGFRIHLKLSVGFIRFGFDASVVRYHRSNNVCCACKIRKRNNDLGKSFSIITITVFSIGLGNCIERSQTSGAARFSYLNDIHNPSIIAADDIFDPCRLLWNVFRSTHTCARMHTHTHTRPQTNTHSRTPNRWITLKFYYFTSEWYNTIIYSSGYTRSSKYSRVRRCTADARTFISLVTHGLFVF